MAPPGNQAVNREHKHQPGASGGTHLLDLADRLLDEVTFRSIYSYRLHNIVANRTIRDAKLTVGKGGWSDFLALLQRLNIEIPPNSA